VLYHDKIPVFQSKVLEELKSRDIEQYQPGEGEVIDLGTYLVEGPPVVSVRWAMIIGQWSVDQ
jgi:hypothetical protein